MNTQTIKNDLFSNFSIKFFGTSALALGAMLASQLANAQVVPYTEELWTGPQNLAVTEINSTSIASWQDTYISRLNYSTPSELENNFGNNPQLRVYSDRHGDARRVLIQFDATELPINELTQQVLLKLPVISSNISEIYAIPVTQSWAEGTCNHHYDCPVVDGATWTDTGNGALWQTPGSNPDGLSFEGNIENDYITFNITELAQSWSNGTQNFGIVIGNIDNWMELRMASSENPDAQPSLVIKDLIVNEVTAVQGLPADGPVQVAAYQGTTDNTISAINWTSLPETLGNFGDADTINLYHNRNDSIRRGLLKFDFYELGISSGEYIYSAKLVLTQVQGNTNHISVQPLNTDWAEGSCIHQYDCANDGANWTESAPGQNWLQAGGDGAGSKVMADLNDGTFTLDVTEHMRQWVSGEALNNGWLIMSEHQWMEARLGSSENPDASVRPKLVIEYLH